MEVDIAIASTVRAATALLFAAGLTHKLWSLGDFQRTLGQYLRGFGVDQPRLLPGVAALIVALEASVLAVCLWPGLGVHAGILASATLLAYSGAMAVNIVRGNLLLDCGCTWGIVRQPVSAALVVRNVLLAVIVLTMALPTSDRPLITIDIVAIVLATLTVALLYGAVNHMLGLAGPARRSH
jgi:hypothetical protein